MVSQITPENFDEFKKGKTILDFWAPWCGPCQMFGPIFEQTSKGYADVKFGKVNTDEPVNQLIASQYGIRGIPTCIFLKDGKEVHRFSGALMKTQFEGEIKKTFG